jgi:hypothetical protein
VIWSDAFSGIPVDLTLLNEGDGLGYDVRSFEYDGTPRYIEVKTTRKSKAEPFVVTANEVAFSQENAKQFHLVRVFNWGTNPQCYALSGDLTATAALTPWEWKATPRRRR